MTERYAELHLDGWMGRLSQDVLVVGETPKRFRIRPVGSDPVRLPGRNRYLYPGDTALVPKYAVRFRCLH